MSIFNKFFPHDKEMVFKVKLNFNISLTIFLFFLFFKPFEVNYDNINNLILFFSGFGGITFIVIAIFHIILPGFFPKFLKATEWEIEPPNIICFLILSGSSVAFTFYLRHVGMVPITFYIVFQIVLICMVPVFLLKLIYKNVFWKNQADILSDKLKTQSKQPIQEENNEIVTLSSENKSEKLKLQINNILFIKAADNYVEIMHKDGDKISKKLLRNTLKNIELQFTDSDNFIRCHRTYIVNKNHIKKLSKDFNGDKLILHNFQDDIPVSRHYLLKVRESLNFE